jgi:hypothetical protein
MTDRPESSRPEEPDRGLDVDAAFAEIIAQWEPDEASTWPGPGEDRPDDDALDTDTRSDTGPDAVRPGEGGDDGLRRLFTPAWTPEPSAELEPEAEEEHFVPPPPPPLPTLEPRRKAAWTALVGTPVIALALLVAGVTLPEWMAVGLVLAFVGGFGYLVATMGASTPDDWSGDDGARL